MQKAYQDIYYQSAEGLTLYARDYPNAGKPVIFCLHGLTRNSADFEFIAAHLSKDFRVICPDQRGRGLSEYDPIPANYRPDIYAADMIALAEILSLKHINIIGTSMGGLMAMIINALAPKLIKSCIFNDIGPDIDAAGLERIKSYVGAPARFESWEAAALSIENSNKMAFPNYSKPDWLAFASRTCAEQDGVITFAYDPQISQPFQTQDKAQNEAVAPPDLWPLFIAMSATPTLIIRGQVSDLFSNATLEKMLSCHPNAKGLTLPNIGHAPMLDEPEAVAAITSFFKTIPV